MPFLSANLKLLIHFLIHILVGAIIFTVLAVAAWLLWELTGWLGAHGAPYALLLVCHGISSLLFIVDVVCCGFFAIIEGYKLIAEIWAGVTTDV
jgi:hypothetical protein